MNAASIKTFVQMYKGKLRLSCLNYPLKIHPLAQSSAEAAEAAGLLGKYWQFHDAILSAGSPDTEAVAIEAARLHLDVVAMGKLSRGKAKGIVDSDNLLAKKIMLTGTPSLLLCTPDGKVLKLSSLNQVKEYLK